MPDPIQTPPSKPMTGDAHKAARPDLSDKAADKASSLADQSKEIAGEAVSAASGYASEKAENAKGAVADEISGTADALRKAAGSMRTGSPQERTFGQIADSLADASETLRDKDLGTLVGDVTRFARSNPMAFLGGAALLGFAAVRFVKASAETGTSAAAGHAHARPSTPPYAPRTSPNAPSPNAATPRSQGARDV